jgi:hypothetical protein
MLQRFIPAVAQCTDGHHRVVGQGEGATRTALDDVVVVESVLPNEVHPSAVVFDLLLGAVLRKHQSCSDHNTRHDTHATQHSTAQHSTAQHSTAQQDCVVGQQRSAYSYCC